MMEAEMDNHLGYTPYECSNIDNSCNGKEIKKLLSKYGEVEIDVPQDRNSYFEPQIVKKRQKGISNY